MKNCRRLGVSAGVMSWDFYFLVHFIVFEIFLKNPCVEIFVQNFEFHPQTFFCFFLFAKKFLLVQKTAKWDI